MASVTFQAATRTFAKADRPAVDALDLDVYDGEFLVVVATTPGGTATPGAVPAGGAVVAGAAVAPYGAVAYGCVTYATVGRNVFRRQCPPGRPACWPEISTTTG